MGEIKIAEVCLEGRFDAANHNQICQELNNTLKEQPQLLLINLEALDFLDSRGLSGIISVHNQLKNWNGGLAILCPPGQVRDIFNLTNVSRLVEIFDSRAQVEILINKIRDS
ncbi:Sulfate transporter/antisigma-factor antagonist STAS [Thalassoporum mexicanum PCC 7367]|uniref:STAS domain-containing protein n=1 Tax=Thalassoporum mexicanum TaxID=3457544 RepID=UPI00029F8797|nr:STAS domain-containing protein [Pseudanabaena sp. PCC 7367]AFY71764.1 Sulfate transporter/antisigma-factor antagonist STAS [Pseudanabaena sp. PCC 7367]